MKKLSLSLLFSIALLMTMRANQITTDLGPIQLITTDGASTFAPGTVNFSGTINIGQSINDSIVIQGANVTLRASNHIHATCNDVLPVANLSGYIVLAIDRTGNITTSHSNNIFKIGSDASGKNYLSIDNATVANGIKLNSSTVYFQGQNLSPASGATNILTIDSNGKIGIVLSAKAYKKEIRSIDIELNNSFDDIKPVAYSYKNSDNVEYGFLAEDLIDNELLRHAIIYAPDGSLMSINYQTIFVALTADYLNTKRALKNIMEELDLKNEEMSQWIVKCDQMKTELVALNTESIATKKELKTIKTKLNAKDTSMSQLQLKCEALELALIEISNQIKK